MKKFFLLIALIASVQVAHSQCTPFLGGDKTICVGNTPVNYADLYNTNASFAATVLPPADTLYGAGGAVDTVLHWASKTKLVATLPNGCKDSSILRVRNRVYPVPNLGLDTTVYLTVQQEITSILPMANGITFISGYNNHNWSTPTPGNVDTGKYLLTVITHDGCGDDRLISVVCALKKDTIVKKCNEFTYDLTTLFVKAGYTNLWKTIRFIQGDTILTATPAAVDTGRYMLLTSKPGRCTDTIFVTVQNLPRLNLGPDRNVVKCFGSTINVTLEFLLYGLTTLWSIPDATKAPVGTHRLIATNSNGCKDTAFITVRDTTKPNLGPDQFTTLCPADDPVNLNSNFVLTGLNAEWNTPNPAAVQAAGTYQLIAQNGFGCKDSAYFTIFHFEKPAFLRDTAIALCFGQTKDLNTIYNFPPGYSLVDWSTLTPATAGAGLHIITVADNFQGCNFTAVVTIIVQAANTEMLTRCWYNAINSGFSTDAFRTITVDKKGRVWAGASLGGIYRFNQLNNTCFIDNTWDKFTPTSGIPTINNTYRDLHSSNRVGDSSLWAASIGHNLPYNITGGVDHITDFNSPVIHYGSQNSPSVNGGLSSRNVNSIAISKRGNLYASLGVSLQTTSTFDSALDGGAFVYNLNTAPASFTPLNLNLAATENRYNAVGIRNDEVWFGYDNSSSIRRIQKWDDAANTYAGFIDQTNSPIPFNSSGLVVRAILTDSVGRTYVGLNSGFGIAMLDSNSTGATPQWYLVNPASIPLPGGASVNFNSITQVVDEIWIGTTGGLLVYNGYGSFTECSSWRLYTTANNLPSNNVTDIAVDTINFNIWLTTDAGICKLVLDQRVSGTVVNVNAGRYDALLPELSKTPLKNVEVKLIKASGPATGVVVDNIVTNATGNFEFANLSPFITYKVEVRYSGKDYQYYYQYNNVKYNTLFTPILIPDSLNSELDTLKLRLLKHKFEFELYTHKFDTLFFIDDFLRTADGYVLDNFKHSFEYINNNLLTADFDKRVNNIANYYLDLVAIYNMGIKASDYKLKQLESFADAAEALKSLADAMGQALKIVSPGKYIFDIFSKSAEAETKFSATADVAKSIVEYFSDKLKTASTKQLESIKLDDPVQTADLQKTIKEFTPFLGQAIDLITKVILEGGPDVLKDEMLALVKKSFFIYLTKRDYTDFCRELHNKLVPNLAQYATQLNSGITYSENYKLIQHPTNVLPQKSLNKQIIDSSAVLDAKIASLKESSETAETIISCAATAAELAPIVAGIIGGAVSGGAGIIPGVGIGLRVGRAIRGIETVVHGFNVYDLFKSTFAANDGRAFVRKISRYVVPTSGFSSLPLRFNGGHQSFAFASLDSLVAKKNKYNQKVAELTSITSSPYDSSSYYTKFSEFFLADSAFNIELKNALNSIFPKAVNAIDAISVFKNKFDDAFENKADSQTTSRISFNLLQMSYQLSPFDDTTKQRLETIKTQAINYSNSTVFAFQELVDLINTNNIQAPAYLVQTNFKLQFNNQPDSGGTLTYTLKNIGNVNQNNVTAQMTQPTGGFTINSVPFVNLGTIVPGQSKELTYSFTAPHTDTSGTYQIIINADNGQFNNLAGTLITVTPTQVTSIANGLWSNPATWSTNRVPTATSIVTVKHQVDVDISTATCKTIKAIAPGLLKVKAGMKLSVMK